ncbi:ATP-binding cassette sub-family C member 4-like [Cylas formicarius]|uniref:ATP-binding cassette sub-family C member 4-like n=1 Tax=Cylas formicarius TaxID=197179 RepID=UPI002958B13F|nr:ATP-binding cassette sub-family C member 4-like [Cylas formicarius]
MDQEDRQVKKKNPREGASFLSIITFCFTFPILRKGWKKDISEADIYKVLPKYKSEDLGDKLESQWVKDTKIKQKPSITKCLVKCYIKYYMFLGVVQLCMKTAFVLLQPRAVSKFIAYFSPAQTSISKADVYGYAFMVIGINLINCIYNHNFQQWVAEYSLTIRTSLCSLVYRKALKLSPTAFSEPAMGKVVTMITKDVFSIDGALPFLNDMWIGLIQTIVVTFVLYRKIGSSVFVGIGFFLLVIPIQTFCARKGALNRLKAAKKTEERIQLVQETLSAIKIIKMYTWEKYFEKLINAARIKETSRLRIIYYLKALILTLGGLTMKVAVYLVIITYTLTGYQATAEMIFFIQQSFVVLKSCITTSIPMGVSHSAELVASLKRIQAYLTADEFVPKDNSKSVATHPRIYLNKVSMHIKDKEILKSVSLDIEKGLLIVSGNVGSGKSSLLQTIINEYPISGGELIVKGTISYAPEEPWLFPSTIKQNILFGQPYNEQRYYEVLKACALTYDINQFEKVDNTVIGDKGINLSRGQQARISLARAVYKDSDIYLLDDCLSALDGEVNKHVFRECIRHFLKDKICILVTNNINNIKYVPNSNLLYMENGMTLDLVQQKESLDKRITYYIDEDGNYPIEDSDVEAETNVDEDATESDQLLRQRNSEPNRNMYHEEAKTGKVLLKNYVSYYKYAGGILVLLFMIILFVTCQITVSYADKLVSVWVNVEAKLTKFQIKNQTDSDEYASTVLKRDRMLNLYTIMIIVSTGLSLVRAFSNFYFCTKAGRNLHRVLVEGVVNAYMSFFDNHFIGNVVNRVAKDMHTIDEAVPFVIYENLRSFFLIIATMVLIVSVNLIFLVPAAFLFLILYVIQRFYMPTGRSIKRLEAATRSPMVGYVNASLEGITTVRACEQEKLLKYEFDRHQDVYTSVFYMNITTVRWFAFVLDLSCTAFIAVVVLKFAIFSEGTLGGDVGLAVTQAMILTGLLQWSIRQAAEMENTMTSVERILEYAETDTEKKTGQVFTDWPRNGSIKYKNVRLSYKTTGEVALKDITFEIQGGSKIGIVGRTGAGKSSIISTLFRLYDFEGHIFIDGEDIKSLDLEFLRSKIGIIPQDPILFSGTIRTNIDPLNKYTDSEIWLAIEKVQLKNLVTGLDQPVTNGGQSYSSGQRQLLCLARALISNNKIVVLDEATANMDPQTDASLQKTIKECFAQCTVLTIAHRLNTFIQADKVLVVDGGRIVEFDEPTVLLGNRDGAFYRMMKEVGTVNFL